MHRTLRIGGLLALGLALGGCGSEEVAQQVGEADRVERGRYLVENVARCQDCHTPLNAEGLADRSQWLQGAEIAWAPLEAGSTWGEIAPAIAGFPGYEDGEVVMLLETGMFPDGSTLDPPMPRFRMTREDATAVMLYLRSLSE